MCGIVGIAGQQNPAWVSAMNSKIIHRGPDDAGEYRSTDGMVTLAMRRLSIIDLASGHQPMANSDGSIWIVFNGEIFNAPELRRKLEAAGERLITDHSDTEVLLRLYERTGRACLQQLNGMFAFVIYDRRHNVLFGARDRMGIKPLYYWQGSGRFAFGSELKSLLAVPAVSREIDEQSLFHYMTLLYVPDQASMIRGIRRLPPSTSFIYEIESGALSLERYWKLRFEPDASHDENAWAEILRDELGKAVKRWTLSDVPIACSLSGGIDSSAIVGLLNEQGHAKLKTYSLGFADAQEESWNELKLARQVSQRWGTDHHEIVLRPQELLSDLIRMVWHLDEPYGGGLPSWYVFRAMSHDVKVGLTGTGGDELFGNYGKFRAYESSRWLQLALAGRRRLNGSFDKLVSLLSPIEAVTESLPSSWRWIGQGRGFSELRGIMSEPFGQYYYANFQYLSDDCKRRHVLHAKDDLENTSSYLQSVYDGISATELRDGLAAVDFRTQLAEEFLFMTDRFSMAHSLEARVPFLDHLLVETVFRIPAKLRSRSNDLKFLLKKAIGDLLPADLLAAQKKGFVIPVEIWLRRELRELAERLLGRERLRRQGLFNPEFYDRYVQPHLSGTATHTWQVWPALMFQLWHLVFIEEKETDCPGYGWEALC